MITVGDLIEILENFDINAEVKLATQPSWPLRFDVHEIVQVEDEEAKTNFVYISEGYGCGYLPDDVKRELDW